MKSSTQRHGFSMIELIFVIVILGILAAIAIPKLAATRDDAKMTKEVEEVREAIEDLEDYYVANGQWSSDIAQMTNVPLFKVNLSTGKTLYWYRINNVPCAEFSLDDNGTLGVSAANTTSACTQIATLLIDEGLAGIHNDPKTYVLGGEKVHY